MFDPLPAVAGTEGDVRVTFYPFPVPRTAGAHLNWLSQRAYERRSAKKVRVIINPSYLSTTDDIPGLVETFAESTAYRDPSAVCDFMREKFPQGGYFLRFERNPGDNSWHVADPHRLRNPSNGNLIWITFFVVTDNVLSDIISFYNFI